ncbi:MAG: zinc ribbon domain-containing protein [Promethearchaeota archaeon]
MNWNYYQLEQFIIQKAEQTGKIVLFVNPQYTSQCCSQCGHIEKKNRKKQRIFLCKECGYELNADLNASRNISKLGKSVFGRDSVNSPNVACDEVKGSYKEQLRRSIVTSHLVQ